ncbi:hypothetical protein GCM10023153_22900 [Ornithinibacter aureus]|uniref:Uncharacterized protein n=1 Tax=Ornithinibacter aureus TaxID=622664 RepID=A0ABP8JYY8_9MICO
MRHRENIANVEGGFPPPRLVLADRDVVDGVPVVRLGPFDGGDATMSSGKSRVGYLHARGLTRLP